MRAVLNSPSAIQATSRATRYSGPRNNKGKKGMARSGSAWKQGVIACLLAAAALLLATPGYAQQRLWETRIFTDRCPTKPTLDNARVIAPLLLTIGSSLIPKFADFGINLATQSFQAKKAEEQSKTDARSADGVGIIESFYEDREEGGEPTTHVKLDLQCLIVIRGDFGPPDESPYDPGKCTKYTDAGLTERAV